MSNEATDEKDEGAVTSAGGGVPEPPRTAVLLRRTADLLYPLSDWAGWALAGYCLLAAIAVPLMAPMYAVRAHRTMSNLEIAYECGVMLASAVLFWRVAKRNIIAAFIASAALAGFFLLGAIRSGYFGWLFFVLLALTLAIFLPAMLTLLARRASEKGTTP